MYANGKDVTSNCTFSANNLSYNRNGQERDTYKYTDYKVLCNYNGHQIYASVPIYYRDNRKTAVDSDVELVSISFSDTSSITIPADSIINEEYVNFKYIKYIDYMKQYVSISDVSKYSGYSVKAKLNRPSTCVLYSLTAYKYTYNNSVAYYKIKSVKETGTVYGSMGTTDGTNHSCNPYKLGNDYYELRWDVHGSFPRSLQVFAPYNCQFKSNTYCLNYDYEKYVVYGATLYY